MVRIDVGLIPQHLSHDGHYCLYTFLLSGLSPSFSFDFAVRDLVISSAVALSQLRLSLGLGKLNLSSQLRRGL